MSWKIAPIGRGSDLLYSQAGTPSLDLRFAEKKALTDYVSGDNLVTFSRSTSGSSYATYVDSDGLIKPSPVNLLTYSEQFENTAWFRGSVTLDPNVATAPNGSQTADKLIWNSGATSNNLIRQTSTDRGTATNPIVRFALTGSGIPTVVSALAPGSNYDITNVGNGWYRCWLYDATAGQTLSVYAKADGFNSIQLQFYVSNRYIYVTDTVATQGNGTSGVYLWGAQLETGTTPTTYIPTTSSASGAPRFDHDPTTGESLGLLVEEARTNFRTYSNAPYRSGGAGLVWSPDQLSPDGTMTAVKIADDTSTSQHYVQVNEYPTMAAGTYTISVFAKAAGRNRFSIKGANLTNVTFDLSTVSVVSGTGGAITAAGNGWFRCSVTEATANSNFYQWFVCLNTNTGSGFQSYTGDGVSGVVIWGAQVEAGSFPTSYIPTAGSTVTRAADVVEIAGTNFSSWYNQNEGTMFADFTINSRQDSPPYRGVYSSALAICRLDALKGAGGSPQTQRSIPVGENRQAAAFSSSLGTIKEYINGSNTVTLSPVGANLSSSLTIGRDVFFSELSGTISRLTYWPQRLPDTTLQTITT